MRRTVKYTLLFILSFIIYDVSAQNSQVLYYMNLSQNHILNPALRPSNTVYIGLPVVSGVNLNINNNFMNFSDVIMKKPSSDELITIFHPDYDISKFLPKIKDINAIQSQALIQLFGLGFNAGKDLYVFLDINERAESNIAIPGDLFRLALQGNDQFSGNQIDLSSLRGDIIIYHEAGLGFSKNFTGKLRLGMKAKLLFGDMAASIDNRSLGITINDDYTHTLNADLDLNLSDPLLIEVTPDNKIDTVYFDSKRFEKTGGDLDPAKLADYVLKNKNIGLGLDIGAEYRFNDRLRISAAVTDLGYIKWKRDITNLKAKSEFVFSGIDMLDVYNGKMTFDSLGQELVDSLKNSFTLTDSKNAFTTYNPIGVSFGGCYYLTKSLSLGILSYSRIVGKQIKEALTVSANVNFGNHFSTSVAYTAANSRYDNLGFGLAFRLGWFQIYALADRIPVTWNKIISDGKTIPIPESWNTIHGRLGMNLAFGNKQEKKKDKPMVVVK